jgi:hypothetical protein
MSSESRTPDLKSLVSATAAVVFMGTLHKGSKQWASKGDRGRRIAGALFMDNNPALLDSLGLKNGELLRSANKFTQLWEESVFTVKTYIEDRSLIGGEKVRPASSNYDVFDLTVFRSFLTNLLSLAIPKSRPCRSLVITLEYANSMERTMRIG